MRIDFVTYTSLPCLHRKKDCFLYSHIIVRIVSTYLVHHGYCATAEAFAKSTGQSFTEELASIKNRQSKSATASDIPVILLVDHS